MEKGKERCGESSRAEECEKVLDLFRYCKHVTVSPHV